LSNDLKREIRDYVEEMAKVYGFCYSTAKQTMFDRRCDEPAQIQAMASTLFIATQRKFGL
jgi:hypothetical protein